MATELVMPKLSDTMKEGTVVKWVKHEGDHVDAGEVIAEIQSDKATIEFEAYAGGVLKKIYVGEDETVPVGELIGIIADEDEEVGEAPAAKPQKTEAEEQQKQEAVEAEQASAGEGEPKAKQQPAAKQEKRAKREKKEQVAEVAVSEKTAEAPPAQPAEAPAAKRQQAEARRRVKPAEGLARVKFGGRGHETGLDQAAADRVIAAARARLERGDV